MQIGPFYPLGYNSGSNYYGPQSYSTLTDSTQYLTFAHRTYMPRTKRFLWMGFEIVEIPVIFAQCKTYKERIRTLPDPLGPRCKRLHLERVTGALNGSAHLLVFHF